MASFHGHGREADRKNPAMGDRGQMEGRVSVPFEMKNRKEDMEGLEGKGGREKKGKEKGT